VIARALWAALLIAALGCREQAAGVTTPTSPVPPGAVVWTYGVRVTDASHLAIDGTFAAGSGNALEIDDDATPFVSDVQYASSTAWTPAARDEAGWRVPCAAGCRVKYAFDLGGAADRIGDVETAGRAAGVIVAPPSTWLLRPSAGASVPGARFRFRTTATDPRDRFATGIHAAPDGSADTFEAYVDAMPSASFAVFGRFDLVSVMQGEARVDVAIAAEGLPLTKDETLVWVRRAVAGIAAYYGRFPVARTLVVVVPGTAPETEGVTLGDGGAAVVLRMAKAWTAAAAADDWVLTHELLHVTLPTLGRAHAWLEEGIATYVEPIVRARAGIVTVDRYWRELAAGLPQGEPAPGDEGLERTHTWGRTYWGGALFCFEADLRIRETTHDARSFDDVLRAVVATGDDVEKHWDMARFIAVGDGAIGGTTLADLYRERALAPGPVDLAGLWARLGVTVDPRGVAFDESAPLAAVRRAIIRPPTVRTGAANGD
jgi:hypothetical protein